MKSPWHEIDAAFCPMFDMAVAVTTKDGEKTTLRAAVFTDGTGDPLAADALDTDRQDVTLVFARRDWPFVQKVRRGDTITMQNKRTFKVAGVDDDFALGVIITARQC